MLGFAKINITTRSHNIETKAYKPLVRPQNTTDGDGAEAEARYVLRRLGDASTSVAYISPATVLPPPYYVI